VNCLQHPNQKIQQNALGLINALLSKADVKRREMLKKTLSSRKYRDIILANIVSLFVSLFVPK